MTVNSAYGPLFVPADAEKAMLALLEAWLPSYLAEVERQHDLEPGILARPKFYGTSVEADHHPGEELPAIIVVAPGTDDAPMQEQGGVWSAWYQATVVAMVMTPNEIAVRELAGYYAAAIRGAVLQHASIGGIADATWWLGEEFQGEPGAQRNRTRGACLVHFRIRITGVVDSARGPATPNDDPLDAYPGWPNVQLVETSTENDP